ncbi:hypothetical protein LOTGIDRAFT_169295 [Lottia gigantea]|uniref:Uncharacterized protein n=1 Tax=Lottia gigantea TaxID=225164 RepID=V3ZH06_LOTGI|nr:hypothetical protein LOTGIDRAFT_169295 [Lottia gigantea]ESO83432.1 hypothetical protein LOTGIDRAFT_169295 [Lottia gigantea]
MPAYLMTIRRKPTKTMSVRQKYPGFLPPRFDGIFRPQTTTTSKIFNSSVYPTGVRTKSLQNIQSQKTTCMFDFTKKEKPEIKCTTSQEIRKSCTPGLSPRGFRDTPRSGRSFRDGGCNWVTTEQKQNTPDVRDHLYINTFFPEERPMRYRELTLPSIHQDRPWSVSEGNPSKRFSKHDAHQLIGTDSRRQHKPRIGLAGTSKKDSPDTNLLSVSFDVKQIPNPNKEQDIQHSKGFANGVRRIYNSPNYPKRPVASEPGRYRPFSTVNIHKSRQISAQVSNSPKHFVSVNQYMKYVEDKLFEERVKVSNPTNTAELCPRTGINTSLSQYHDPTIRALQSVIHVNMPSSKGHSSSGSSSSLTSTGSR